MPRPRPCQMRARTAPAEDDPTHPLPNQTLHHRLEDPAAAMTIEGVIAAVSMIRMTRTMNTILPAGHATTRARIEVAM